MWEKIGWRRIKENIDYLKKLHVRNIGIFDHAEVDFSKRINIIIGPNSTGKTSLLKLITYCFNMSGMSFSRFRTGAELWIDYSYEGKNYRAGATEIVDENQAYREFKTSKTGWKRVPNSDVKNTYLPYDDNDYKLLAIGAHRYFDYLNIPGMNKEILGKKRKKYYDEHNYISLEKPDLPSIKQWMVNRYFVLDKEWAKTEKKNWNRLQKHLPKLFPNSDFKFDKIERDLEPIFIMNGKPCYLEELSGGFKSILSIIFSIVDWCEGVNLETDANIENCTGTVLIDEIDAHLHPEWQYVIIPNLTSLFPKLQFIFTTHSPYVISSANENEIIQIPTHEGTVKAEPTKKSFKGWQVENILSDLMGVVNRDEQISNPILVKIDEALENKDLKGFEREFSRLEKILHPDDSILKVYSIKKSQVFL